MRQRSITETIRRAAAVTVLMVLAAGCVVAGRGMPPGAQGPPEPPTYAISGNAFSFAPPGFPGWGRIEGATVSVLEMPGVETTTVDDGYFEIDDLPIRRDITLVLEADGFPVTHTQTFRLTDADIEQVTFQVPNLGLYQLLAGVVGAELADDKCQIVSTATFLGGSLYLPNAHGEPDARVMLNPTDHDADGPIYFNESVIPDRSQELTSADGGVVFINVEPGDYILHAHKPGVRFERTEMKCRPGVMVNASPPHALQVIAYEGVHDA